MHSQTMSLGDPYNISMPIIEDGGATDKQEESNKDNKAHIFISMLDRLLTLPEEGSHERKM